jgi:NADP-reducing hydrogenase subunit HndC
MIMRRIELMIPSESMRMKSSQINDGSIRITVGMGTCGISAGAERVFNKFLNTIRRQGLNDIEVVKTGCIGLCWLEPIVDVCKGGDKATYVNVTLEMADRIIQEHLFNDRVIKEYTMNNEAMNAYKRQKRIALHNCGIIDPENIDEYISRKGYHALHKCLTELKADQVVDIIKMSGLRGRGGGGFLTGRKWGYVRDSESDVKYVCCNADEGDPGAFMDRAILEGDPHSVIEAMAIAGYAIGAKQGYIYVRSEYPVAVKRLRTAIIQAREKGFLGEYILGSSFSFDVDLRLGSGAFVCGEETALMRSIKGSRGEPRPRPPFPAEEGLFGKPTLLNNVETFANVCQIINNGPEWFSSIGTERSKGTKVFALAGKINNTGLIEVPMGTTLRQIIFDIGGGIANGKKFKSAQIGGPSGSCLSEDYLDTPMDYDSLASIHSMMGSGGLVVMDEDTCMVNVAKFFLEFAVDESCGKCPPCRIGTRHMLDLLTAITTGEGKLEDINKLEKLAVKIKETALCGFGKTIPNLVLSTLRHFKKEYEDHITMRQCVAGVCKPLLTYQIDKEKCTDCSLCAKICPAEAIVSISDNRYIDVEACTKCGVCMERCKFGAIIRG